MSIAAISSNAAAYAGIFAVPKPDTIDRSAARDEFLTFAAKSPAEHLRDQILRELGVTEEKLQAMEPKQRAAMEETIAERLKQKVEQEAEKRAGLLVDVSA